MFALITSDLHLTNRPEDGYRFAVFKQIRNAIQRNPEIKLVIIAGDVFNDCDRHPNALLIRVVNELMQLVELDVHVVLLKGNHDYTDETEPTLSILDGIPGIQYVSDPVVSQFGAYRVSLIPHSYEWDVKSPFTGVIPNGGLRSSWDLIVMHQTVSGAISESGVALASQLTVDMLSSEETRGVPVISGDVHVPQVIGNVTYCGAPHSIRYGDHYDPRMIVYDLAKHTMKSIPTPGPRRVRIVLRREADGSWEELNQVPSLNSGDSVRIRVQGSLREQLEWPRCYKQIHDHYSQDGVLVNEVRLELVKQSVDDEESQGSEGEAMLSEADVFARFCKDENIPNEYVEGVRAWLPWCFES